MINDHMLCLSKRIQVSPEVKAMKNTFERRVLQHPPWPKMSLSKGVPPREKKKSLPKRGRLNFGKDVHILKIPESVN